MQNNNTPLIIAIIVILVIVGFTSKDNKPMNTTTDTSFFGKDFGQSDTKNKSATKENIEYNVKKVEERIKTLEEEVDSLVEAEKRSPYSGIVSIIKVQDLGSSDPNREYLVLSMSKNNTEKISITGWKIKSDTSGKTASIGNGTLVYYPNIALQNEPIILSPGDTAIISSGSSPIGLTFKTNKCTGYLAQFNNFYPYIRQECPSPKDENINFVPQTPVNFPCLDYIEALPRCQINTRPLRTNFSPECHAFIAEKISYQGCLSLHRNDKDFYGDEWRIYLRQTESLWLNRRETIRLIDENGKTVSTYVKS